jgi:hypothetical protein
MMTKGKYWCGDLCYVLDNDWDQVCNFLFGKGGKGGGESQLENGVRFAVYGTAWGDGGYLDQHGNCYGVDAGVIGCVKVDDLYKIGEAPASGGHIHEFDNDFETGYDEGTIYFGDLRIETDPKADEEDEEECASCGNPTYSLACHCDGWDDEEKED